MDDNTATNLQIQAAGADLSAAIVALAGAIIKLPPENRHPIGDQLRAAHELASQTYALLDSLVAATK